MNLILTMFWLAEQQETNGKRDHHYIIQLGSVCLKRRRINQRQWIKLEEWVLKFLPCYVLYWFWTIDFWCWRVPIHVLNRNMWYRNELPFIENSISICPRHKTFTCDSVDKAVSIPHQDHMEFSGRAFQIQALVSDGAVN